MDEPRQFLPLTPQQFHILLALAGAHRHGYGIIREVAESDRRAPADEDEDRRRYYRLTPLGRAVLKAETERLEALVRHARAKGIVGAGRPAFSRSK